jgi:hypothetical protein
VEALDVLSFWKKIFHSLRSVTSANLLEPTLSSLLFCPIIFAFEFNEA